MKTDRPHKPHLDEMGIATWHEFKPARGKSAPDGTDSPSPLAGEGRAAKPRGLRRQDDTADYKSPRKPTLDEMGPGIESVPARRGPSLEGRSTMGRPGQHGGFRANKKKR